MSDPSLPHTLAAVLYLLALIPLVPFGLHRLELLWIRLRRPEPAQPAPWEGPLPRVTVQLPIYNEANVVERLIDAACGLDYPRDRLEIQLLDDSDDVTVEIAARSIAGWRARGVDAHHVRRETRSGFKAGALAYGNRLATGDFLLVLDADFVPPPGLVRDLLPSFGDPRVGVVQAAWAHLNEDENWVTRAQALFLDAHFAIEHAARHRAGLFFNFNGSAGMWRRSCVESSGGWRADTLTEDLDLSYRAQLAGWRFIYRDDVRVPAELPCRLRAVEVQQERWAQGGVQTARALLGDLWTSRFRLAVKLEGTAHLLGHAAHPLTLALGVGLAALGYLGAARAGIPGWVHLGALGVATAPFVLFYGSAARLRGVALRAVPRRVLEAMLLGLGLGIPLTGAVLRGLSGARTPFRRTPKRGDSPVRRYPAPGARAAAAVRVALGLSLAGAIANLAQLGVLGAIPFTGLFAAGYLATARESLRQVPSFVE